MKNAPKQQMSDAIGGAPRFWSAHLMQVCLIGVTPFFVIDDTARSAP